MRTFSDLKPQRSMNESTSSGWSKYRSDPRFQAITMASDLGWRHSRAQSERNMIVHAEARRKAKREAQKVPSNVMELSVGIAPAGLLGNNPAMDVPISNGKEVENSIKPGTASDAIKSHRGINPNNSVSTGSGSRSNTVQAVGANNNDPLSSGSGFADRDRAKSSANAIKQAPGGNVNRTVSSVKGVASLSPATFATAANANADTGDGTAPKTDNEKSLSNSLDLLPPSEG